jgi:hypothetical protein
MKMRNTWEKAQGKYEQVQWVTMKLKTVYCAMLRCQHSAVYHDDKELLAARWGRRFGGWYCPLCY